MAMNAATLIGILGLPTDTHNATLAGLDAHSAAG
jgi:hypothetical protein